MVLVLFDVVVVLKFSVKMTSLAFEPEVVPVNNIVEGFFQKLPIDNTRTRFRLENIQPTTAVIPKTKSVSFKLSSKDYPFSYELSKIFIDLKIRIIKKDLRTLPESGAKVTCINNILSSFFQYCSVQINNACITDTPDYYYYKGKSPSIHWSLKFWTEISACNHLACCK